MGFRFRDLDAFVAHKIKETELFERTLPGAWLTLSGSFVLLMLFVAEMNAYFTPVWHSEVVMHDTSPIANSLLPVSFDVTLPKVSCQFASVDVDDVTGRRRHNVTANVEKWKVDPSNNALRSAESLPPPPQYGHVDHKDGEVLAAQLTSNNFQEFLTGNSISMVNFYAPWCHWSRKLQPVWEHTAGILHDIDDTVKFGRVDCTDAAAQPLCRSNHIQAYPTIIVFHSGKTHSHEHYHGDRTPEALLKAILSVADKQDPDKARAMRRQLVNRNILEADPNAPVPTPAAQVAPQECDDDKNGTIVAKPDGCRVKGKLWVHRVPGSITFSLQSAGMSFDAAAVNASHIVNSISFGDAGIVNPTGFPDQAHLEQERAKVPVLTDKTYSAKQPHSIFMHYVKVVGHRTNFVNGDVVTSDRFSINSHHYQSATEDFPHIRFTYDLSPMTVLSVESYKPFYEFVTSLCAIIGGVFTVIGLLDSFVYKGMKSMRAKMELGKQG